MKKILLSIFVFFCGYEATIAAPYLTQQQKNIIKAIVVTDYENAKNNTHSMIFDNQSQLTPELVDIVVSQIIHVANTGVENVDWGSLNQSPMISTHQYTWILVSAIFTSYTTHKWVCKQYDDECINFARNDSFPDINLSNTQERVIEKRATNQLKEMGIKYQYSN